MLSPVRNFMQSPQKGIPVSEIGKHINGAPGGESLGANTVGNADERNANGTARARIPDAIADVNRAFKFTIPSGCP